MLHSIHYNVTVARLVVCVCLWRLSFSGLLLCDHISDAIFHRHCTPFCQANITWFISTFCDFLPLVSSQINVCWYVCIITISHCIILVRYTVGHNTSCELFYSSEKARIHILRCHGKILHCFTIWSVSKIIVTIHNWIIHCCPLIMVKKDCTFIYFRKVKPKMAAVILQ